MLNKVSIFFISLFLIGGFDLIHAQDSQKATQLKSLDWLVGTWKRDSNRGPVFEKWMKVSNITFEGLGFRVSEGDTVLLEFLRIEQFGQEIFYTPKVAHNKYPVPFKLTRRDEKGFLFEHPEHDFPQRIIYKQKKDGSLYVRVEGAQDGKESGFDVNFVRVE